MLRGACRRMRVMLVSAPPCCLALALGACTQADRITVHFLDEGARTEAAQLALFAIGHLTDTGERIGCDELLSQARSPADADLSVAQQIALELPLSPGQSPLLVQVPQARYLFLARAHDRFGFLVAQGCEQAEVTARRPLNLEIALATVPAATGRLIAVGATAWMQPEGVAGLEGAPRLEVQTEDARGRPQDGIEVRALVEEGSAVPLDEVFWTTGSEGRGHTVCIAAPGRARVLLHARGLEGSPIAYEVVGVAAPEYASYNLSESGFTPIALIKGDLYLDQASADDLLVVVVDAEGKGLGWYWAGKNDGLTGWKVESAELLRLDDGASWYRPTHGAIGNVNEDCWEGDGPCQQRADLVLAAIDPATAAPRLAYYMHHSTDGDRLDEAMNETALPDDIVAIEKVVGINIDGDPFLDLALLVSYPGTDGQPRQAALVYSAQPRQTAPGDSHLQLRQRLAIPPATNQLHQADLAAGDVDGDGDDELLVIYPGEPISIVPCYGELGSGATPYRPAGELHDWPQLITPMGPKQVTLGDVDGDGSDDVVVVTLPRDTDFSPGVQVAFSTGDLETCPLAASDCTDLQLDAKRELDRDKVGQFEQILVDDLNGDGHLDLLTAGAERACLLAGDGTGRFSAPLIIPLNMLRLDGVQATALDLDQVPDLAFLGVVPDVNERLKMQLRVRLTDGSLPP